MTVVTVYEVGSVACTQGPGFEYCCYLNVFSLPYLKKKTKNEKEARDVYFKMAL